MLQRQASSIVCASPRKRAFAQRVGNPAARAQLTPNAALRQHQRLACALQPPQRQQTSESNSPIAGTSGEQFPWQTHQWLLDHHPPFEVRNFWHAPFASHQIAAFRLRAIVRFNRLRSLLYPLPQTRVASVCSASTHSSALRPTLKGCSLTRATQRARGQTFTHSRNC